VDASATASLWGVRALIFSYFLGGLDMIFEESFTSSFLVVVLPVVYI
jgi:hypothetical protein